MALWRRSKYLQHVSALSFLKYIYVCLCTYISIYLCVYIYLYLLHILSLLSVCVCHSCCLCRGGCVDSGVVVVTWVRCCGPRGASCSCPCFTYRSHVPRLISFFICRSLGRWLLYFAFHNLSVCVYFSPSLLCITLSISIRVCVVFLLSIINVHKQHITHARVHGQNTGFSCYLTPSSWFGGPLRICRWWINRTDPHQTMASYLPCGLHCFRK